MFTKIHNGFQITFPNRWTASIIWDLTGRDKPDPLAEVAVFHNNGELVELAGRNEDGFHDYADVVMPGLSARQVLEVLNMIEKLPNRPYTRLHFDLGEF